MAFPLLWVRTSPPVQRHLPGHGYGRGDVCGRSGRPGECVVVLAPVMFLNPADRSTMASTDLTISKAVVANPDLTFTVQEDTTNALSVVTNDEIYTTGGHAGASPAVTQGNHGGEVTFDVGGPKVFYTPARQLLRHGDVHLHRQRRPGPQRLDHGQRDRRERQRRPHGQRRRVPGRPHGRPADSERAGQRHRCAGRRGDADDRVGHYAQRRRDRQHHQRQHAPAVHARPRASTAPRRSPTRSATATAEATPPRSPSPPPAVQFRLETTDLTRQPGLRCEPERHLPVERLRPGHPPEHGLRTAACSGLSGRDVRQTPRW